jgi:hypothetical protein
MKYDRRAIMRNAWTIRHESGCTMSAALKKAWTVAKKGNDMEELRIPHMSGSEKQIAWATDILNGIYATWTENIKIYTENLEEATKGNAQKSIDRNTKRLDCAKKALEVFVASVNSSDKYKDAHWIIDRRSGIGDAARVAYKYYFDGCPAEDTPNFYENYAFIKNDYGFEF